MEHEAAIRPNTGTQKKHTKMLPNRRRLAVLVSGGIIVIALLVWGAWAFATRPVWPNPQLITASKTADFPVYYPTTLPSGFSYVKGSAKLSADVFIYALAYDGGKHQLHISVEAKPAGVQFDDFYTRILNNESDVLSSQGKAVIGNAGGQTIGSLVTDKSWVTLNTPSNIDTDTLKALIGSLRKL
jgi:hypothetical protein